SEDGVSQTIHPPDSPDEYARGVEPGCLGAGRGGATGTAMTEGAMRASLKALLKGAIDYAGLFPPAKLPFAEALANYLRYQEGPDAWMLGRFICPVARLKEIPAGVSLSCSAIGRGGETAEEFLTALEADLRDISAYRAYHQGRLEIDSLEVKVPASVLAD